MAVSKRSRTAKRAHTARTTRRTRSSRAAPGEKGGGEFYRIVLRSKEEFETFRTQDVGREGHSERIAGQTPEGVWYTQAWLISKSDAHMEGDTLVADEPKAQEILDSLPGRPRHVKGDIFEVRDERSSKQREQEAASR